MMEGEIEAQKDEKPNSVLNSKGLKARDGALVGAVLGAFVGAIGLGIGIIEIYLVYSKDIHGLTSWILVNGRIRPGILFMLLFGVITPIITGTISGMVGLGISKKVHHKVFGGALGGAVGGDAGAVIGAMIVFNSTLGLGVALGDLHEWLLFCLLIAFFCALIGIFAGFISGLVIAGFGVLAGGTLPILMVGGWTSIMIRQSSIMYGFFVDPNDYDIRYSLILWLIYSGVWLSSAIIMRNKGVFRSKKGEAAHLGALGAAIGGICGAMALGVVFLILSMTFL